MIETNSIIKYCQGKDIDYIQFNKLLELGIKHAYTLKKENINFSHKNLDLEKKSYQTICQELDLDYKEITKPKQNHTGTIKIINKPYDTEELIDIDGLITNKKGIILSTTSADCILYLLYDYKKNIIANVHSGWRGTYQRIIEKAINSMVKDFGSNPKDIIICICPSIRKCHFEVDKDVKEMFEKKFSFLKEDYIEKGRKEGKYNIDTVRLNNKLLTNLGISVENIYDSDLCSVCNSDKINSFRTDGIEYKLGTAIITLD